jgi:hypothetical protein
MTFAKVAAEALVVGDLDEEREATRRSRRNRALLFTALAGLGVGVGAHQLWKHRESLGESGRAALGAPPGNAEPGWFRRNSATLGMGVGTVTGAAGLAPHLVHRINTRVGHKGFTPSPRTGNPATRTGRLLNALQAVRDLGSRGLHGTVGFLRRRAPESFDPQFAHLNRYTDLELRRTRLHNPGVSLRGTSATGSSRGDVLAALPDDMRQRITRMSRANPDRRIRDLADELETLIPQSRGVASSQATDQARNTLRRYLGMDKKTSIEKVREAAAQTALGLRSVADTPVGTISRSLGRQIVSSTLQPYVGGVAGGATGYAYERARGQ